MAGFDVIGITAIAISEIEVAVIRPEKKMARVMIELRVIDPKHFAPGIRIDHIGVVKPRPAIRRSHPGDRVGLDPGP